LLGGCPHIGANAPKEEKELGSLLEILMFMSQQNDYDYFCAPVDNPQCHIVVGIACYKLKSNIGPKNRRPHNLHTKSVQNSKAYGKLKTIQIDGDVCSIFMPNIWA